MADEDRVRIPPVRVTPEVNRMLKIAAVTNDRHVQDLVEEAIREYILPRYYHGPEMKK